MFNAESKDFWTEIEGSSDTLEKSFEGDVDTSTKKINDKGLTIAGSSTEWSAVEETW